MQISKISDINTKSNTIKKQININNNLLSKTITLNSLNNNPVAHLNKSSIAFCGMKKSQFSGIDLIMVNKLSKTNGLDIRSKDINSNDDFQSYCQNILDNKYYGEDNIKELSKSIDPQAQLQKEETLKEWIEYISKENDAYNPAIQLLIMSSITKNLSSKTNHLPPVLDKRKVADTIQEITDNSKTTKNYEPNFDKIYRNNLQKTILKTETQLDTSLSGWIVIPSKNNNPDNFEENVKKLQTLSHDSWCTKTYNAEPYLAEGDFHIYMENGKPKLGVRLNEYDEIAEIQGEKNNSKIPLDYLDTAKKYVEEKNFTMNYNTQLEFADAEELKEEIAIIKKDIGEEAFKNKEYDKILQYFEIETEKDEDGMLILSTFKQPSNNISFKDIGVNENDLFKNIKEIKGDAYFKDSEVTSLDNLQSIGGDADFENSKITSLGNLEFIGGNAWFYNSEITSLDNLKSIGRNTIFVNSKVTSLGNLKSIGGYANFKSSKVTSLGNLKSIGGDANFENSKITSLGNLESIGGNAWFYNSKVTSLGNLKFIGGDVYFGNSKLSKNDFENIKIGGKIKSW